MSEKFPQFLENEPTSGESVPNQYETLQGREHIDEQKHNKPAEHIEQIRASIEHVAEKAEQNQERQRLHEQQPAHHHYITRKIKADQYKQTLTAIRLGLSKPQRLLSTVIHQPVIEQLSELGAKTIARPSGILGGASFALFGSIFVLAIAHHIGFQVPNTIFIMLFVLGFFAGLASEIVVTFIHRVRSARRP